MKKFATTTLIALLTNIIIFVIFPIQLSQVAFACVTDADCGGGYICNEKGFCVQKIDVLLPRPGEVGEEFGTKEGEEELQAVGALPEVGAEEIFAETIKTILGWAMGFTIIGIVVAAIYYLKSQGQEEDISKAKNIILYLVVGLVIMAAAYGIVSGLAQFDFFKATP